jgi:ATP-dependent helicase HrpA
VSTDPQLSTLRAEIDAARTADRPELLELLADATARADAMPRLRERLTSSLAEVRKRRSLLPRPTFDDALPISARRAEIAAMIAAHQVCVVCGETGSGKTTQLPKICLELGRGAAGMIGHTQPRRIAARSVAARIAEELRVPLGGAVGAQVRFNDQTSEATAIKLMTDGILLAETQNDPALTRYDTIIIDEAHERSLNIDFLMGYLRTLLPRRPDLKVIITSATIDPQRLSAHFGGPTVAPVIEVSGRMFPVTIKYRPIGRDDDPDRNVSLAVADAVRDLCSPRLPKGDILVFLPGEREIRNAADTLRREDSADAEILPLFARLSAEEQDRVFHPGDRRRVILATNVAETSLTIPGIRYVIDSGYARISRFDHLSKVQRLLVEPISRASAEQRSGRCGRVSEGVCVRLYAEESFKERPKFTDPEILRTSLAAVILKMKSLELGPVDRFPFVEPPTAAAIREGYATLFELGALDGEEPGAELTRLGHRLARLPLDPKIGRVLLAGSELGCLRDVLPLAAALSIQDPRERPMDRQQQADAAHSLFRDETSDFLTLLNIWDEYHEKGDDGGAGLRAWCREHFVSHSRMREWIDTFHQLRELCEDVGLKATRTERDAVRVHQTLLTGLLASVLCRDEAGGSFEYSGPRGLKASIFPGSALFKKAPKWIVAAEIVQTSRVFARTVARIDPEWIGVVAPQVFRHELADASFDRETMSATAFERVTFRGLAVVPRRRVPLAPLDPAQARRLFLRHALAENLWNDDSPFVRHNADVLARAKAVQTKLRRRNVVKDPDAIAQWFAERIPSSVTDAASFRTWYAAASPASPRLLHLSEAEVLNAEAAAASEPSSFPDAISPGDGNPCALAYAWEPGKEEDGLTIKLPLLRLPDARAEALAWVVPGMLAEKTHALLKALPRSDRENLERKAPLQQTAADAASLLTWRESTLPEALAEVLRILHSVDVPAEAFDEKAVPDHLRIRVLVVDEHGKELAAGRDLAALRTQLAGRLTRAQAGAAKKLFERSGITTWDFDPLPAESKADGQATSYPSLIDAGDSIRVSLLPTPRAAQVHTWFGVRRLFALAARDELGARIESMQAWQEAARQYKPLGTTEELRDALICLSCESAFMLGQAPVTSRDEFEARQVSHWGRLGQTTIDVCGVIFRALEARHKVASRIASGTPRIWAISVADIREHAAYLMPRGFIIHTPWERLRHYARYAEAMRERLFRLREDGSGVETGALALFGPHWKKYTGWIARAMTADRAAAENAGEQTKTKPTNTKAPLPQARRVAPTVNVDAGEWTLQPGRLPEPVEHYRWLLEEARLGAFNPESGAKCDPKALEAAWKATGEKQ